MSLDLNFHLEEGNPPLCIISSKDDFMAVIPHYSNHCYTTLQAVELIFVCKYWVCVHQFEHSRNCCYCVDVVYNHTKPFMARV